MDQFKIISKRTVNEYIAVYKNGKLDEEATHAYNGATKESGPIPVSSTTITPVTLSYIPNISVTEIIPQDPPESIENCAYMYQITYTPQDLNFTLPVIVENNGRNLGFNIQGKYKESIEYKYTCNYSSPLPDADKDYVHLDFDYDINSSNWGAVTIDSFKTKFKNGNNTGVMELVGLVIDEAESSHSRKFNVVLRQIGLTQYKVVFNLESQYEYHGNENDYKDAISEVIYVKQIDTGVNLKIQVNRAAAPE